MLPTEHETTADLGHKKLIRYVVICFLFQRES